MSVFPSTGWKGADLLAPSRESATLDNALPRVTTPTPTDSAYNSAGGGWLIVDGPTPPAAYAEYPSVRHAHVGDHWFELLHILPRRIDLGNILTAIVIQLDLYNAHRYESQTIDQFINNAGAGVEISDLPALPYTLPPQRSLLMTLEISTDGPSIIDATLDFDTSEPYLLSIPITGTRVVMFPFEPEAPVVERLEFLTDVLLHKDGTEQRIAVRKAPRQTWDLTFLRDDGRERQAMDNMLFDWQSRVFGMPVWVEPTFLTANATAGDTTITVEDTTLSDYREGGIAIVFESETKFDALEIESVTDTTIEFASPLQNSYSSREWIRVMPIRTVVTTQPAQEKKYAVNLAELRLTMRVLDNDADLSDTDGWPTYNDKVLLSDPNAIDRTLDGSIERRITIFDSSSGAFSIASPWDRARHGSAKTFLTRSRTALWAVRKLLHALKGRQVSFYLPTFTHDVTLADTYISGAAALTVANAGYARFVQDRSPKVDLWIRLLDGTEYTRTIVGSSEVDSETEQLTLSASIGQNIAPSDVEMISFLEKVRIDTDEIVIQHTTANGDAKIGFPVMSVLE